MPSIQQSAQERLRSALGRLAHLPADAGLPAAGAQAQADPTEPYYRFETGEAHWVFPAGVRAEALAQPDWAPLPGASRVLLGLCNLRGELVPVYQIHSLLGDEPPSSPTVLIIGGETQRVGLAVDGLPTRLLIRTADTRATEPERWPEALRSLIVNEFQHQGQSLLQLDVNGLGEALCEYAQGQNPTAEPTSHSSSGVTP